MKIDWASSFAPDGSRRTPPPSTVHGWLAKWRGTLSGNEHLRSRGMAEMRKAAAYRKARRAYEKKKAEKQGNSSSRGLFSFLNRRKAQNHRRSNRLATRPRAQSRPSHSSSHKSSQRSSARRLTTSRKVEPNTSPRPRRPPLVRSRHQPQSSSQRIPGRR